MAGQAGGAGAGTGMERGQGCGQASPSPSILPAQPKHPKLALLMPGSYVSGYWAFGFVVWGFFHVLPLVFFRLISFFLSTF